MQGRPLERDDGSDRRQLGGSHAGQQRAYYDDEGLYREAAEDDEEEEEDEEGGSGAAAMMLLDVDLYGGASGRQVLLPGGLEGAGLHQASEVRWGLRQASAIYCPVNGTNRALYFDFLYLVQQCYGPLTSTCLLHLPLSAPCNPDRVLHGSTPASSGRDLSGPSGSSVRRQQAVAAAVPSSSLTAAASSRGGGRVSSGSDWAAEPVDWPSVLERARERCERDCPICIGALGRRGKMGECVCCVWGGGQRSGAPLPLTRAPCPSPPLVHPAQVLRG